MASRSSAAITPTINPAILYHSESTKLVVVNIVTLVVAVVAVLLRFISRWLSAAHFCWDDGLILLGLILTFGSSAFNFVAAKNGAGKHQETVSPHHQVILAQIIFGIEILYGPLVTAIKCSILMLYLRLFGVRPAFRKTIYVMLGLVLAWCVAIFFASIFQASPHRLLWTLDPKDLPKGAHHIKFQAYLVGTAVPNVVMDFAILVLPLSIVWQLQISRKRKTALSAVFLVGLFVCGVSILRTYAVATVSFIDKTYAYASTLIWSAVEVNVGITCACLPILQPVMQKVFGKLLRTDHSKYAVDAPHALLGNKSSTVKNSSGVTVTGGPFRRLNEDLVQMQMHPLRNSTWVSAGTPVEREVQVNAIHVKSDVDLDQRVEEV